MANNESLKPYFDKVVETLGDVIRAIKAVRDEVQNVRDAIVDGVQTITDAIHENTQARAELKLIERVVEVRSILPQIDAERERIEVEREELDRQLERIAERYEQKHEELDDKAAQRIRDLGAHIFEIDEDQFEDGIEAPFAEHVTTVWQSLQSQNEAFGRQRRERIESTAGDVVSDIHDFVDQQHELIDRIQRLKSDVGGSIPATTTVQLPYYVVTVETDGSTERTVIVPSRTREADGPFRLSLQPLPGMEKLVSPTPMSRTRTDVYDGSSLLDSLEPHIEERNPIVSYGDVLSQSVPDQVDVAVEGGD